MKFSENLQCLRKKENLTQEQFAERLEVSRQAVSKWESGLSYPEMDKLLVICDLFGCDLDTLVKGDVSIGEKEDAFGYNQYMNRYSVMMTGAVVMILAAVTVLAFLHEIVNENLLGIGLIAAVAAAVAVMIVNGVNMEYFEKRYPYIQDFYSEEERSNFTRHFAVAIAAGVCLVFFGICMAIAIEALNIPFKVQFSGGMILLCVTVATGLFVYFGIQKDKYDIESYNKKHDTSGKESKGEVIVGKASGVIMLSATVVFLYLGLVHDLFRIAWVVYPIGGILCAIVSVIWSDKK